jgi:hypothetical protein
MKNRTKVKDTLKEKKILPSNDHMGSDCDSDHTGKDSGSDHSGGDSDNDETKTTEKRRKSKGKFNKPGREVSPDTTGIDTKADKTENK